MSNPNIDALKEQLLEQEVKQQSAVAEKATVEARLMEKAETLRGQTEGVQNAKAAAELYAFIRDEADESSARLALNLLKDTIKEARGAFKRD